MEDANGDYDDSCLKGLNATPQAFVSNSKWLVLKKKFKPKSDL